jgi:hypothetical protein
MVGHRADAPAVRGDGSRVPGVAAPGSEGIGDGTGDELTSADGERRRREETERGDGEGRRGCYSKIKSYLTCRRSPRRLRPSREARPFRGTSWIPRRRAARSVSRRMRSDCRPRCHRLPMPGVVRATIRGPGPHVSVRRTHRVTPCTDTKRARIERIVTTLLERVSDLATIRRRRSLTSGSESPAGGTGRPATTQPSWTVSAR